MDVEVIDTEGLGDRSYVVHDGTNAIVVDPQRDLDRVEDVLDRVGAEVGLVLETHIHNDYVTGGYELARRAGVPYAVNADDPVSFARLPVSDGDRLTAGSLTVEVLHTPGHTDTHLAYVIADTARPARPPAVFSGGSLLYGSVGRTDLVDAARTVELTRAQYRTARRLATLLPDDSAVFPTHGFGSFCSSGPATGERASTIGVEKSRNDALTTADEQQFVDTLVANLTAYPAYYVHMGPLNRRGPAAAHLSTPRPLDATELAERLAAGEWVLDLRDRVAFAGDHLAGSVGMELATTFATYAGWLLPWGAPITLLGDGVEELAEAQRQLARIGIDELAGATTLPLAELAEPVGRRSYPCVDFVGARKLIGPDDVVLDVRRDDERRDGHLAGSAHLPIHELLARADELPPGRLWVHCHSGYRASIAAGLLDRMGRDVVLVDDDYDKAAAAGWRLG